MSHKEQDASACVSIGGEPQCRKDSTSATGAEAEPHDEFLPAMEGRNDRIARAKHEWESTVDTLSQLVCLLDERGRVVRVNRAIEHWQLGRVADVRSCCLHELLHHDCREPGCYLREFWPGAQDRLGLGDAVSFETDDNVLHRRLSLTLRPLATPVGEGRVVAVIDDVTEARHVEVLLRSGFAELEQQVSARTRDLVTTNARLRREIAEREQAEEALRKREASYRRLVESMIEGLIAYGPDGRIEYVNDSLCRMLGFERNELIGEPAEKAMTAVHHCARAQLCDARVVCPGERYEANWLRKDGGRITVLISPHRLEGPEGEYLGCSAVVMDITERKRAEEALQRSESELRLLSAQLIAAQEAERKRIARELHDSIGQTLSALKFQLENASAQLDRGTTGAAAELIGQLVPKVQSAVEEVRRISMDLRPSMLDDLGVLPTIAWFCREFQGVFGNLKVETALGVREEEVPQNLKTVIYRIMQEALCNSARHARASGVRIALERRGAALELSVRDNGVGFEPENCVPHAGDRCGMGLSTMRERAETSGGSFRLESRVGAGTLVRVAWPCFAPA
jgi:PAS domain S-box-containing protein